MHDTVMSNAAEAAPRTPAGDAFTAFVVEVASLGHFLTAAGETLARQGDQSLARWVILDVIAAQPVTVAEIARRRGMARQPVQRIADVLVNDGLTSYQANPNHRRAKLLCLTTAGQAALATINAKQKDWADAHGANIGAEQLNQARELLASIRTHISPPDP